ncbi:ras-induced vulval development antagonist-domain-containing protein [Fimicolochytrium jonesii]|uniref:ras-induced vulval development antagonist-domain-containing protein n=1 Tax=Fimicolochytrium jonesii TaxID=1396493 RepID=UPI0022FE46EF|nr:ras-induced vulval development antagonist-domain-containing protein [Fimicolochytrium jonesii]KAI8826266.1 ras-induced vulval development antagonist-domain-containing protein [Fimicolochytrium jonesii]
MSRSGTRSPPPTSRYSHSSGAPARDARRSRSRSQDQRPSRNPPRDRYYDDERQARNEYRDDRRGRSRERSENQSPPRNIRSERDWENRYESNGPANGHQGGYHREQDGYRGDRRGGHELEQQQGETFQQFLQRRQEIREASTATIWLSSPEVRVRDTSVSPTRKGKSSKRRNRSESGSPARRKKKRSSRDSEDSAGESSDSDAGARRKSRKGKDSRRDRKSKKDKKKKSSKKRRTRTPSPSSSSSSASEGESERAVVAITTSTEKQAEASAEVDETVQDYWREKTVEQVDDAPVGPLPLNVADPKHDDRAYGGALLAGEGSAMAAYLQSGKRIPRRGEIGLTSNEIEDYEKVGFVMSGSRHRRMNAVRIRKENQVISAEEKRALLLFNQEANMKKEAEIIANFKDMVSAKMKPAEDAA